MLFRLVRPLKRSGSRNRYFVKRIPADVKARAAGMKLAIPLGDSTHAITVSPRADSIRFSLRTDDPAEVKARLAAVEVYLENVWRSLRTDGPISLSHKQATALAGELYRAWAHGAERERTTAMEFVPGVGWQPASPEEDSDEWDAVLDHWRALPADDTQALERALGPLVDRLLLARGIRQVDEPTRAMLLKAFWQAARDAFETRKRNSEGDYSPDPKSDRFPEWTSPHASRPAAAGLSLKGLVEAWWLEAKATGRKPSTYESYRNTMANFVDFLGQDDATRVVREDVVRFKDHRLASVHPRTGKRISPKTVKDSDLAGLKTVFGWAKVNGKVTSNPAEGVTVKLGKRPKLRSKSFTVPEAEAILRAALRVEQGQERPETFAAKRWVPWLCAYTGGRVGELAQLRKEDIRREGKHWVVTITPEAGTVKNNEARDVVLHPHLVELGFIEFVKRAPKGHLFLRPAGSGVSVR